MNIYTYDHEILIRLDAVKYKIAGTNHNPTPYVCEDFRDLRYDKIREVSLHHFLTQGPMTALKIISLRRFENVCSAQ